MDSLTAYQRYRIYMMVRLFLALRGDFDFTVDSRAYQAMANGDGKLVTDCTANRLSNAGINFNDVKFKPQRKDVKKPSKGTLMAAGEVYAAEYEKHCANPDTIAEILASAPMHLTHTTGEQGAKGKDGTLVAHYTVERPAVVESAFGITNNDESVFGDRGLTS